MASLPEAVPIEAIPDREETLFADLSAMTTVRRSKPWPRLSGIADDDEYRFVAQMNVVVARDEHMPSSSFHDYFVALHLARLIP